jgi:hypothetical protein
MTSVGTVNYFHSRVRTRRKTIRTTRTTQRRQDVTMKTMIVAFLRPHDAPTASRANISNSDPKTDRPE